MPDGAGTVSRIGVKVSATATTPFLPSSKSCSSVCRSPNWKSTFPRPRFFVDVLLFSSSSSRSSVMLLSLLFKLSIAKVSATRMVSPYAFTLTKFSSFFFRISNVSSSSSSSSYSVNSFVFFFSFVELNAIFCASRNSAVGDNERPLNSSESSSSSSSVAFFCVSINGDLIL